MNNHKWAAIAGVVLLVIFTLLLYQSTGPPADHQVISRQIELINQSLDSIEQEVASVRAPSQLPFATFVLSVVTPLAAAIWLIWRAECSTIHHDHMIRKLIELGYDPTSVRILGRRSPDLPQDSIRQITQQLQSSLSKE